MHIKAGVVKRHNNKQIKDILLYKTNTSLSYKYLNITNTIGKIYVPLLVKSATKKVTNNWQLK